MTTAAEEIIVAPEPVGGRAAQGLLPAYARKMYARWDGPLSASAQPEVPASGLVPPTGLFLVARVGGRPAGCAGLRALDGDVGELKRRFVRPDYRGRGLARLLLAAVEAETVRRGLTRRA